MSCAFLSCRLCWRDGSARLWHAMCKPISKHLAYPFGVRIPRFLILSVLSVRTRLGGSALREFPDFKKDRSETPQVILDRGMEYIIQLCNVVPQIVAGLDVVLASSITGSWTAFEVLAGDLWVAAVNAHPHTLSVMKGKLVNWEIPKAARGTEDTNRESGNKKGGETGPQISVKWLEFHNYNVSQKMGTLLRQRKTADFQTVWDIREAYARAFESDYSAIRNSLADESLDHLSALRNVLVHKAGKADDKFVEDIAGCEHFASISERDPVILDGEIVADLVWSVVNQASSLLSAVDAWRR